MYGCPPPPPSEPLSPDCLLDHIPDTEPPPPVMPTLHRKFDQETTADPVKASAIAHIGYVMALMTREELLELVAFVDPRWGGR